jgi:hypothetical protein
VRIKKRILIPGLLLALFLFVLAFMAIRGSCAPRRFLVPAASSDGIHAQLYRRPDGRIVVRSSVVFDLPMPSIWGVLTDPSRLEATYPYLKNVRLEGAAGGPNRLTGTMQVLWQTVPVDIDLKLVQSQGSCEITWEGSRAPFRANVGRWALTALAPGSTRLTGEADIELGTFPGFLVRNHVLDQVENTLRGVASCLGQKPTADHARP